MIDALSAATPDAESLRKVLEAKTAYLSTVVSACMLWWVSSVVFCGSVLSSVYVKRREVKRLRHVDWFLGIVAFFFLSIVVFGTGVGALMTIEKNQTGELLKVT
jgi:hypothetical protein